MSKLIAIEFEKLHPDAKLPVYSTEESVGMDVCALYTSDFFDGYQVLPGSRVVVSTGLSVKLPRDFELQVRPRSGLAMKNGITVVNTPGTIDPDYRDEIKIIILNTGQQPFYIKNGDRIAQLVLAPVYRAIINGVAPAGAKRDGGFGSTGV